MYLNSKVSLLKNITNTHEQEWKKYILFCQRQKYLVTYTHNV